MDRQISPEINRRHTRRVMKNYTCAGLSFATLKFDRVLSVIKRG